jgi:hypothetical protein
VGSTLHADRGPPFGPAGSYVAPRGAAGTAHRFEDVSDDLVVWVVFYGPEGGEVPAQRGR